jgi:hypothetical protein
MQGREDSGLRPRRQPTKKRQYVRPRVADSHKDVKNADRSGDMYENKGSQDIMTENISDIFGKMTPISKISRSFRLLHQLYSSHPQPSGSFEECGFCRDSLKGDQRFEAGTSLS